MKFDTCVTNLNNFTLIFWTIVGVRLDSRHAHFNILSNAYRRHSSFTKSLTFRVEHLGNLHYQTDCRKTLKPLHLFFPLYLGRANGKDTSSLSAAKKGGALANVG